MGVLVKVVHAAVVSVQDPRIEVRRRMLNYRNTPHLLTGKSLVEIMMRRQIKTRLPTIMKKMEEKIDTEAGTGQDIKRKKED